MQSVSSRPKISVCHFFFSLALPASLTALLLLSPCRLQAHSPEQLLKGSAQQEQAIGLDEHLGARIPLDLILRDEAGEPVRLGELLTVPTVILPVYYGCTNVCVYLQSRVAGALQNIGLRPVVDYRVVSISIDETETPEMARRSKKMYLGAMNPPFPESGWRFLTGDAASIRKLTDSLGFNFQRQGRDFLHPVASMIVSSDGTIVRYLYGTTILPKDLALALTEAKNGITGVSIRKLMEYCFTFDPQAKTYVFNLLRVSATVVIICTGGFMAFLILGRRKTRAKDSSRKDAETQRKDQ